MSARKKKPVKPKKARTGLKPDQPAAPPHRPLIREFLGRKFDLRSEKDSPAFTTFFARKEKEAHEVLEDTFSQIRENIDRIDRTLISVLTDLAGRGELDATMAELAHIANASFCIRLKLPGGMYGEGTEAAP